MACLPGKAVDKLCCQEILYYRECDVAAQWAKGKVRRVEKVIIDAEGYKGTLPWISVEKTVKASWAVQVLKKSKKKRGVEAR